MKNTKRTQSYFCRFFLFIILCLGIFLTLLIFCLYIRVSDFVLYGVSVYVMCVSVSVYFLCFLFDFVCLLTFVLF